MAISDEEVYLLNRMNSHASKTQLGTLIQEAEAIGAVAGALAEGTIFLGDSGGDAVELDVSGEGEILVGDGTTAAMVAVSGDITLASTGVTAIGAAKVLSSMLSNTAGVRKVHRYDVGYAALNTAGTAVPLLLGTAIPDNAIILHAHYEVVTEFTGNGDGTSNLSMGIENQVDDLQSDQIGNAGWAQGFLDTACDGTAAERIKLSAARQLAVIWTIGGTDTALTAGAMNVFIEYVVGA